MPVRVLIADDHRLIRESISLYLKAIPEIEVIGEADNGREALILLEECLPDVVLMDLMMPDLNGIEATRKIAARFPQCKVLVLSGNFENRMIVEALKAGAKGFIMKSCVSAKELVTAIMTVSDNGNYFSQPITDLILVDYLNLCDGEISPDLSPLSPREKEILQLIAEGKNAKEIAFVLELSHKTINAHRQNIMKKLKLGSVAELTRYAIQAGIIT